MGSEMCIRDRLVAEDERDLNTVITKTLVKNHYSVDSCYDGEEALSFLETAEYDAVILDIMMPKMDGLSAVREIRKTKNIPVMVLSARGEEYDKLFGFEAGIDDYVTKPFSPKEVVARIKAILGRTAPEHPVNKRNVKKFGGLIVDFDGRNVIVDGKKADLTPKEYEVLFFLVKNEGLAISREKLLSNVWGFDFYGDDRTVDTHIKMLRSNLGPYRDCIVTLRGLGYKFEYDENIEY